MSNDPIKELYDEAFSELRQQREGFTPELALQEVGEVAMVLNSIARVTGLPGAGFEELLKFPGDLYGIAFNLDVNDIGVVLLGDYWHLNAGDKVERTGRVMDTPVGDGLIGRVIDPLGKPLDGKGPLSFTKRLPIERPAPAIMERAAVNAPLQTGIKVIDALIPVGRGQRELILGDRQSGKTAIAIEKAFESGEVTEIILYYNRPQEGSIYGPIRLRFLPIDEVWIKELGVKNWPTKNIPEALNGPTFTLKALIREYLFVTLFRASAKSLASENASRLAAMQRAEKNIKDLLNDLNLTYHQLRQSSIDEEMFDVIFGSEAMADQ